MSLSIPALTSLLAHQRSRINSLHEDAAFYKGSRTHFSQEGYIDSAEMCDVKLQKVSKKLRSLVALQVALKQTLKESLADERMFKQADDWYAEEQGIFAEMHDTFGEAV